jgi:hypothetical protein
MSPATVFLQDGLELADVAEPGFKVVPGREFPPGEVEEIGLEGFPVGYPEILGKKMSFWAFDPADGMHRVRFWR